MSTCSGLEEAKSGCTAPEQDPVLFELSKGLTVLPVCGDEAEGGSRQTETEFHQGLYRG